jgi:hypothetical protein
MVSILRAGKNYLCISCGDWTTYLPAQSRITQLIHNPGHSELFRRYVLSTDSIGKAMLAVARHGAPKAVPDIAGMKVDIRGINARIPAHVVPRIDAVKDFRECASRGTERRVRCHPEIIVRSQGRSMGRQSRVAS